LNALINTPGFSLAASLKDQLEALDREQVAKMGRNFNTDEVAMFALGFQAGCNAKADQIQPIITELELRLHQACK
tara:strand:- start:1483 stop:1707 length:225 start_codon:yes stop_codon:yes gene_type:complete